MLPKSSLTSQSVTKLQYKRWRFCCCRKRPKAIEESRQILTRFRRILCLWTHKKKKKMKKKKKKMALHSLSCKFSTQEVDRITQSLSELSPGHLNSDAGTKLMTASRRSEVNNFESS